MPRYITVDNRVEAKPAEVNYKSQCLQNAMEIMLIRSHVKLKAEYHYTSRNESHRKQVKIESTVLKICDGHMTTASIPPL